MRSKDGMGPVEPMTAAKMHHLLIEAIERNMNGEIFTFEKPEEITEDVTRVSQKPH
jgi:hypothetical protein